MTAFLPRNTDEIALNAHSRQQATVCGGDRYDGLVKELGEPETPAVGWPIGLERLIVLLQQLDSTTPQAKIFTWFLEGQTPRPTPLFSPTNCTTPVFMRNYT